MSTSHEQEIKRPKKSDWRDNVGWCGTFSRKNGIYSSTFFAIHLFQDKFGPPAGGQRPAQPSSSSRYEPSRDHGRGGDSYGYSSSSQRGYRDEGSRRDHHGHDMYDGAGITSHSSMVSIPSGPAAGSGDQIYVRNVSFIIFFTIYNRRLLILS